MTTTALLVDDARFMREVLRDIVAPLVDATLDAASAEEAVALAREHRPRLITLDMTLDHAETVQGLRALSELREVAPDARICVVSALDQDWLRKATLSGGADAYVPKPFEHDALRTLLRTLMEEGS